MKASALRPGRVIPYTAARLSCRRHRQLWPGRALVLLSLAAIALSACTRSAPRSSSSASPSITTITTSSGVEMVLLPGGDLMMVSDAGGDESPRHKVHIDPFLIDKYEVTQRQFADLEIPDPSHFKDPDRPVEQIRWSDAILYCNARSESEGLEPCYDEETFACDFQASGYRLPTEAEWEYAARAGTRTAYFFGDSSDRLTSFACFKANAKQRTDRVGHKRPNPWGLCDMLGNVSEWCHDVYAADYYQRSPVDNPRGPEKGPKRVLRGGSWKSSAEACRVAARLGKVAGFTDACFTGDMLGCRAVRRLTDEQQQKIAGPVAGSSASKP